MDAEGPARGGLPWVAAGRRGTCQGASYRVLYSVLTCSSTFFLFVSPVAAHKQAFLVLHMDFSLMAYTNFLDVRGFSSMECTRPENACALSVETREESCRGGGEREEESPAWFPWYMRRLAERPANLWFVLRKAFSN